MLEKYKNKNFALNDEYNIKRHQMAVDAIKMKYGIKEQDTDFKYFSQMWEA